MSRSRSLIEPQQRTWGPRQPCLSHTILLCPQRSGLSEWLGNKLTPLQSVPPPAIVVILSLLVATFTECTSNVATTTIFLPILASMVSWPSETPPPGSPPACPTGASACWAEYPVFAPPLFLFLKRTPEFPSFSRLLSHLGPQGTLAPDSPRPS